MNGGFLYDRAATPWPTTQSPTKSRTLRRGHPSQGDTYHYHDIPQLHRPRHSGRSVDRRRLAFDGYPIVVERDAAGNLP